MNFSSMKRVSATEFIKKIGAYMESAQQMPLAITSHGRERVILLSPQEYKRLKIAGMQNSKQSSSSSSPIKSDALTTTLSIVNTSTPVRIDEDDLRRLIKRPFSKLKPQARLLVEEVPEGVLAGLVKDGVATWSALAKLAVWAGVQDRERTTFLRDMAAN